MSLSFSPTPWAYDSTSPYPPSSPSSSDSEYVNGRDSTHLRSSIAILPEAKLRTLMLKLASRDPHFQRAIVKELSRTNPSPTTPTTPTPVKQRKWHRKSRQNVKNLSISTKSLCTLSQVHHEIEDMYHPGRLEEEVYEFISVLPDRTHVVRKVTMWSCCDEDEWSPGCISASATAFPLHLRHRKSLINVSPDFDIERVGR